MERTIRIEVETLQGKKEIVCDVKTLACAIYCGRDRAKVRRDLEELRKKGYAVEDENPSICKISRYLITTDNKIEVQGIRTSAEVETVALVDGGEIFVTVGSDHHDVTLEEKYTDKPKQICQKIMSPKFWRYTEVRDHWDELVMRSEVTIEGRKTLYQTAPLKELVTLEDLLKIDNIKADGLVLFCGSVHPVVHRQFPKDFYMELRDPVLNRSIHHHYDVYPLTDKP